MNTVSEESEMDIGGGGGVEASDAAKRRVRPCELYICNLPRNYDISHLLELFKPYGTVHSVEVSRDPETGISRGCGFVTMGSISEAKYAIAALDGMLLGVKCELSFRSTWFLVEKMSRL